MKCTTCARRDGYHPGATAYWLGTCTCANLSRTEMMKRLTAIQNKTDHQDILTITAWMDDQQLAEHLKRYEVTK